MPISQNEHFIPRDALMRLMDNLSEKQIIYICAPAGYGKTVSMRQWLKRRSIDNAIVNLDEYDNDMVDFCKRFCSALMTLQPDNASLREFALHPSFDSAPDEFTIRALNTIRTDKPARMVIEDIHFITNQALLRLIPILIKRLPETFQVLILSRNEPSASFSELFAKGALAVVTAESLRFSRDEVILFFKNSQKYITQKQADDILDSTDGWAIGINALLLSGDQPSTQRLANTHLVSFIKTQVWEKWDESIREFMIKTSVADELTPSLCVALTGEPDSAGILEHIARENSFLSPTGNNSYRFHQLFRAFLHKMLEERGKDFLLAQTEKAGEWFLAQGDFYRSVDCFIKCKNYDGIAKCFGLLDGTSRNSFFIDKMIPILHALAETSVTDKYPFLLAMLSWAAFSEGNAADMKKYMDEYYWRLPEILQQMPYLSSDIMFMKCLDYRVTMRQIEQAVREMPVKPVMRPDSATVTQNMPLFHRSSRDFSEYAGAEMKADLRLLKDAIGDLFGDERDLMETCLIAGILYEQGNLAEAYQYALSANASIRPDFCPELKFCAMVILVYILDALSQQEQAQEVLKRLEEMIERDRAYYLNDNLNAFIYRRMFDKGDIKAANKWLDEHDSNPHNALSFYKLFEHFTTARAYITKGDYESAIIILMKLVQFCEDYKRPLDVIEGHILIAIAYWKKMRGFQTIALKNLEQAISLAHGYDYTQIFANEGAELTNMLNKLKNRSAWQKSTGAISGNFTKRLFLQSMQQAKNNKGMTSGQPVKSLKYTDKQKTVMKLMCEGNSYKQIAESMGIKFSTVRSHIELIYKKLDVLGENEAILKIKELKILEEE